jgi:hypothetical protein
MLMQALLELGDYSDWFDAIVKKYHRVSIPDLWRNRSGWVARITSNANLPEKVDGSIEAVDEEDDDEKWNAYEAEAAEAMEARTAGTGPEPEDDEDDEHNDDDDEDVGPVEAQAVGKRSSAVAEAAWTPPATTKGSRNCLTTMTGSLESSHCQPITCRSCYKDSGECRILQ